MTPCKLFMQIANESTAGKMHDANRLKTQHGPATYKRPFNSGKNDMEGRLSFLL